jgi:hypothetical protein
MANISDSPKPLIPSAARTGMMPNACRRLALLLDYNHVAIDMRL